MFLSACCRYCRSSVRWNNAGSAEPEPFAVIRHQNSPSDQGIALNQRMWRGGTALLGGHGTEKKLRFGRSVVKAENAFRGTIPFIGHGTEQNFKFSGSVAERPSSVDTERDKI